MSKLFARVSTEDTVNGVTITVNDKMQKSYSYVRTAKKGVWITQYPDFKPELTPNEMLRLGVFEGKYLNDCTNEFPSDLYVKAKLSDTPDELLNYYRIKSRQPLSEWKKNGWTDNEDIRGWFQWYTRFYYGRRSVNDKKQISRWKSFVARHLAQVNKNCKKNDINCRPKQKQGLLQWAMDPKNM